MSNKGLVTTYRCVDDNQHDLLITGETLAIHILELVIKHNLTFTVMYICGLNKATIVHIMKTVNYMTKALEITEMFAGFIRFQKKVQQVSQRSRKPNSV